MHCFICRWHVSWSLGGSNHQLTDGLIQWQHFWTDLSRLSKVSKSSHEFTRRCSHLWHRGRERENKTDLLLSLPLSFLRASPVSQQVMQEAQETQVWSLGWENRLEEEMATHSRILAWWIPWTEEPGGLSQNNEYFGNQTNHSILSWDWLSMTVNNITKFSDFKQYHLLFYSFCEPWIWAQIS